MADSEPESREGEHVSEAFVHRPVLGREVVELLSPVPTGTVIDCTVGGGGHAALLLEARPDLRVLGIDRDDAALTAAARALERFGDRVRLVRAEFSAIARVTPTGEAIVGVLFDLGVSSPQLDRAERGFSYWTDAPLDMRMDIRQELTAAEVLNTYPEAELAGILAELGEERFARRIAAEIVRRRPLETTGDLVEAVKTAIPAPARRRGGHPARRTFQAIRMEVNRELPNLREGLDDSVHLLTPGGRTLVLAYHSLEDRMVKQTFATWAGIDAEAGTRPRGLPPVVEAEPLVRLITRKPIRPRADELAANPRAASARRRAVERLA
ncbi:MAG: 16S rRNA (cytosine(1402)-N(4))-methyltransferase RsmH [Acidimicrobiia bacterium]